MFIDKLTADRETELTSGGPLTLSGTDILDSTMLLQRSFYSLAHKDADEVEGIDEVTLARSVRSGEYRKWRESADP